MSDIGQLVERLVEAGLSIAEAGEIVATAVAIGAASTASRKSTSAARQQRYRDRNKASQSVTALRSAEASQSVTNRNESVTSDASSLSIESKKEEIKKEKREKARASRLPDCWQVDQVDFDYAIAKQIEPSRIRTIGEAFANHHRAKGTTFVDWHAAWRKWIGNEIEYRGTKNGHTVGQARTVGAAGSTATGADTLLAGMGRIADRIAARKLAERQDSLDLAGEPDPLAGRA